MEAIESKTMLQVDDSQIFLEENVKGFQQCVKEILKLIEQEETPEIHDEKKSKLATHVAELSRMHGALIDQNIHFIKKQHLDSTDSSSPQITQMFTPDQMSNTQKFRTPIGFDVLLSSGGNGSYASRKEGSESSFSLSSDSDSESFMSINKLLISPVNTDAAKVKEPKIPDFLLQKITNLEDEIVTLNAELQSLVDENNNLKQQIQENESVIKTQNVNLETEKMKVIELEKEVANLNLEIYESDVQIKMFEKELNASREKFSSAEDEILKLNHKLRSFQQEIMLLEKQLESEKESNLGLQEEVSLCVADISVRDDQITELYTKMNQSTNEISLLKTTHKAKEDTLNADIERLQMEILEKSRLVEDLNKNFDYLNLLKDGVIAQLDTLRAEKCSQDNLVRELEARLKLLQFEHERVLSSFDNEQKVTNGLKLKVNELEREVELQREVMSDRAEEKREVIRQLSFSLEHYMSGYKKLRHAFVVGNKKHGVFI